EEGDRLQCIVVANGDARIVGDRELLTQLFANLIENAIRHAPPGTDIAIKLETRGDRLVAVVADTGPGVPTCEHENVFRRLYRLERARSTPGSGLGLSLVAAVADLHGATVTLADNGPGLCVEVSFPRFGKN
ncbi:MAG TPA: sensor histidine kinase, partial [Hyphomicrobium sp.]|nr:sensor histidine kinase [Hyphomicrobium sp.]